ncbi:MAG: phosphatase PAP2 family protein [Pyrinomonadaceae bacterium]
MSPKFPITHRIWRGLLLLAASQLTVVCALAQSQPASAPPGPTSTPSLERQFIKNIFHDQRAIWTAPFRLRRQDARRLAPLGLSTVALLATDQETDEFGNNRRRLSISRDISYAGNLYATAGVATAFYLAGRATGNQRARETGLLGGEALINSGIVYAVLKSATQRPRPGHDDSQGEFFDGGHSFPSGHATSAWALATVIAHEYGKRRAVQIGAYGLATAVSIARFTGRNHFLSDTLVGSAIGYGIGRYVYRAHHDPTLDAGSSTPPEDVGRSRRIPFVTPHYNRMARAYGLTLAWNF